jgi:prepilin-type N-terminal cleavage/methylation domain-containing protein
MRRVHRPAGFTLIELMVVVGIVGVLSAIAIPSFAKMVRRSKTAEVASNLNAMFKDAAAYYAAERSSQGQTASVSGFCTVQDGAPSPTTPGRDKQAFVADEGFRALGFSVGDAVYFQYGFATKGSGVSLCGQNPSTPDLYTFFAHGDLDGNGTTSSFELATGSDAQNLLMHSVGLHIENETE